MVSPAIFVSREILVAKRASALIRLWNGLSALVRRHLRCANRFVTALAFGVVCFSIAFREEVISKAHDFYHLTTLLAAAEHGTVLPEVIV